MDQFLNTASQVAVAIATVLGLWFAVKQQMRQQVIDREARLTRLEANMENTLRDNENLNRQRHNENLGNIADVRSSMIGLKDVMTDKIHRIEISLARAGINGYIQKKPERHD